MQQSQSESDHEPPYSWHAMGLTFEYVNKGANTKAQSEAHDRRQKELEAQLASAGVADAGKAESSIDDWIAKSGIVKAEKLASDGRTQKWTIPLDDSTLTITLKK